MLALILQVHPLRHLHVFAHPITSHMAVRHEWLLVQMLFVLRLVLEVIEHLLKVLLRYSGS